MNKSMNRAVIGALPILARSISNRAGVKLVMNASCAQTDGKEIHLPPLPIEDPDTTALALGFIGHEAEHVRDTDMGLFRQACLIPEMGDLLNALEDIRIERGAAERLPGLKSTFNTCIEAIKAKGMMVTPETSSNPISDLLHFKLRVSKLENECIRAEADGFEALVRSTMGDQFTEGLLAFGDEIDNTHCTRDVYNLSERILTYVKQAPPPPPPEPSKPDDQDDDKQGEQGDWNPGDSSGEKHSDPEEQEPKGDDNPQEGSSGEGDKKGDSQDQGDQPDENQPKGSGDDEQEGEDPNGDGNGQESGAGESGQGDQGDGQSQDGEGSEGSESVGGQPGAGKSCSGNTSGDSEAQPGQVGSPGNSSGNGGGGQGDQPGQQGKSEQGAAGQPGKQTEACHPASSGEYSKGEWGGKAKEMLKAMLESKGNNSFDMGKALSEALGEASEQCHSTDGVVAEEAGSLGGSGGAEIELEAVQASSTGLRARIERLLQAEAEVEPYSARSGRRLDRTRLWRVSTGNYKVFRKEDESLSMDTAIVSLVDRSVSMRDQNRIKVAREAALSLCIALDRVEGLATSVAAFPGQRDGEVWVAKSFGQKARNCVSRFGVNPNGGTPLTQALLWAGDALLRRQEKRKIIIVKTDGEPNNLESAKATIHALEAMGIEVFGLGIGISVSHLFKTSTSMADVSQLPTKLSSMLQEILLGRSKSGLRKAA